VHGAQEEVFILSLSLIFLLVNPFFALAEESITITTYYPSPYGSYKELSSYRMKIGSTYSTTSMTDADNGKLIVEGLVGIGTTSPAYKFTIAGTGSIFGVDNQTVFLAKNSAGTYENYLWPRWSDNITYLNYGSGGFNIRNNASTSTMFLTNAGNVGIGTTDPGSYGGQQSKLDVNGYAAANDVWLKNVGKWASQLEAVKAGVLVYSCPNQRAADESGCIGQLTLESFCYWCTRQDRGSCKRWTTKPCIPVGQLVE